MPAFVETPVDDWWPTIAACKTQSQFFCYDHWKRAQYNNNIFSTIAVHNARGPVLSRITGIDCQFRSFTFLLSAAMLFLILAY